MLMLLNLILENVAVSHGVVRGDLELDQTLMYIQKDVKSCQNGGGNCGGIEQRQNGGELMVL